MAEWHHRLNGHEFEQTLGDGEGQGSLEFCSPWDHTESDTTEHVCHGYVTALLLRNLEQQAQILSGTGGALLLHFSEL